MESIDVRVWGTRRKKGEKDILLHARLIQNDTSITGESLHSKSNPPIISLRMLKKSQIPYDIACFTNNAERIKEEVKRDNISRGQSKMGNITFILKYAAPPGCYRL